MHGERKRNAGERQSHDTIRLVHDQRAGEQGAEQVGHDHGALNFHILETQRIAVGN
jgi:hypothetical protein